MELARQVTRLVLEQRSHRATDKQLDDAVDEVVECVSSLGECSVRCVLGHAACGRRCAAASTVEVWTMRVVAAGETSEPGLDGVFLRQAVRSHLHFSQLASWMHKQQLDGGEEEEREYVVRYRLSRIPSLCASPPSVADEGEQPRRHAFPVSRAVDGARLAVSVEYLAVDSIERPAKCDRGTDEWPSSQLLRDSPASSPDAPPPPPPPVVPMLRVQLPRLPPPTSLCLPAPLCASVEHRSGKKHKWRQVDGELVSPDSCARAAKLPALEREEEEERGPDATDGIAEMRIEEEEERQSRHPRRALNLGVGAYVMPALPGFNRKTGLPTHSSPAPLARRKKGGDAEEGGRGRRLFAPAAPLLGSFEESALNGRLSPAATLDGYSMQISAAGVFCSPHRVLPVQTVVFGREEVGGEENAEAPVASMGVCNLSVLESKKGYRIPLKGTVQATLFNPEGTAVHVFLVGYDVSDMPPRSRTFLRQRTVLTRAGGAGGKWLRYLIHLRVASDSHRRIFLHSDVRVLVGQNRTLDAMGLGEGQVPLREVREVEVPDRPRYSPR